MLAAIKKEPKRTAPGCPALFSAPSAPFNRRRCRSRPRACGTGADCLCIHACLRTMFSTFSTWFSTFFLLPSSCLGPGCGKLISCIGPHINFSTYGPIVDFGGFSRKKCGKLEGKHVAFWTIPLQNIFQCRKVAALHLAQRVHNAVQRAQGLVPPALLQRRGEL